MNILILFATEKEARGTISRLKAQPAKLPGTYRSGSCTIVLTGIGLFSAMRAAEQLIPKADLLINAGIAGSFDKMLPPGSIHEVAKISYLSHEHTTPFETHLFPDIHIQDSGAHLFSAYMPIYKLYKQSGLIDMEGYALGSLAKQLNKPIKFFKAVSDHCSEDSSALMRSRMDELSERLSMHLEEQLELIQLLFSPEEEP